MLQNIPKSLHADMYKLVPVSVLSKCACCVIYDGHPRGEKKIDITICSEQGEVEEFYQRKKISSIQIEGSCNFTEIKILRNNQGELFYLLAAERESEKEVIIISSKDILSILGKEKHVQQYEVCDAQCTGEAVLKIVTKTFTKYLSIADNFKVIDDEDPQSLKDVEPVLSDLETKLNEAKYNLQENDKAYKQILNLRQWITYSNQEADAVQIETPKPYVRLCNKKIVIKLQLHNPYDESMEKVSVLIHNNSCKSISYNSILYKQLATCPFYKEIANQEITGQCKSSVAVAVIPFKEFKYSIISRIEFSVVVSYQRRGKDYLQSFGSVNVSASDVMGLNFDVFNSTKIDDHGLILAMLSTTDKTTLCLKQVFSPSQEFTRVKQKTIFCEYLGMELLQSERKVAIHRRFPHHILHGMMVIFDNDYVESIEPSFSYTISVYTRVPSQVLALIHFIYDKVPHSIIVTTPNIRGSDDREMPMIDSKQCVSSLIQQASMTIGYLDDCLKEMNKSKREDVRSKLGLEIDLFAMGFQKFEEYRNKMLAEAENCVEHFVNPSVQDVDLEYMETD